MDVEKSIENCNEHDASIEDLVRKYVMSHSVLFDIANEVINIIDGRFQLKVIEEVAAYFASKAIKEDQESS